RCVPAGLPAGQGAGRLHRSGRTLGARPGARNPAGRRRERAVPQVIGPFWENWLCRHTDAHTVAADMELRAATGGRSERAIGEVRFRVLGPVGAQAGTIELDLGGLRQRAVLARLLVARGKVVPVRTLLFDLWDDDAARNALSSLQVYVSRLRRVLEPDRPRGGPNRLLVTVGSGYALRAAPDRVDALRFEDAVRTAGERLTERPQAARAALESALASWRGTPYADFAEEPWAEAEVARLNELHLIARERYADAGLRLGLHAETVPGLEALPAEPPPRERSE